MFNEHFLRKTLLSQTMCGGRIACKLWIPHVFNCALWWCFGPHFVYLSKMSDGVSEILSSQLYLADDCPEVVFPFKMWPSILPTFYVLNLLQFYYLHTNKILIDLHCLFLVHSPIYWHSFSIGQTDTSWLAWLRTNAMSLANYHIEISIKIKK